MLRFCRLNEFCSLLACSWAVRRRGNTAGLGKTLKKEPSASLAGSCARCTQNNMGYRYIELYVYNIISTVRTQTKLLRLPNRKQTRGQKDRVENWFRLRKSPSRSILRTWHFTSKPNSKQLAAPAPRGAGGNEGLLESKAGSAAPGDSGGSPK